MRVSAKLQIVGEDEVGQPRPVTLELLVGLHALQIRANVLALDVAYRHVSTSDDEVRRAAGDVRRLVDGAHGVAAKTFDQRL